MRGGNRGCPTGRLVAASTRTSLWADSFTSRVDTVADLADQSQGIPAQDSPNATVPPRSYEFALSTTEQALPEVQYHRDSLASHAELEHSTHSNLDPTAKTPDASLVSSANQQPENSHPPMEKLVKLLGSMVSERPSEDSGAMPHDQPGQATTPVNIPDMSLGPEISKPVSSMNGAFVLNLTSQRARKARLGQWFAAGKSAVLVGVGVVLVLGGIGLLTIAVAIGWLLLGLSFIPLMIFLWYQNDLVSIRPTNGGGLDDVLGSRILGNLRDNPSPRQIAEAAMHSLGGRFLAVRFGLTPALVQNSASINPADAAAVWEKAEALRVATGEKELHGSMLVAALCETQPELKAALPHLQLDLEDLDSGVRWSTRLLHLIEESKHPVKTGGIARDWNFGYANLLERFGSNISEQVTGHGLLHTHLDSHVGVMKQLYDIFGGGGRQNIALVGALGAGKTSLVHAFAESLINGKVGLPKALKYKQVIGLDASAIISAARNRSELEGLVNHLFVEAYRAKNIILFLDDAELFFEEGSGAIDLSSMLLPVLSSGRLQLILAMEEQAFLRISQRTPGLVSVMNRLNVSPASEDETMAVMQDQIIRIEDTHKVTFLYQALKETYRLSERYVHDVAQPGRSIRVLEQSARFAENGMVTARSVDMSIEQTSGVKVGRSDDAAERDQLLHMEDLIHERMVNQVRAVRVVSDALRRARAGVRNEKRPIGTFLFLGPTGVGKTELAKALAAVYFGGEDRMVRLDLNEFVRPDDVSRLIADGSEDSHSLTASILKQPFSVVLLDEIEKAHPQVLSTLLQMLDEGVLRDIKNREVSFREAIVIATSNAGAEKIRQLIDEGKELAQFEDQFVDELIDSQQFRPEFLNRFDEIVVFRPLNKSELVQVVERMIDGVNKTLAPQKIQVTLTPEAAAKLAEIGYDPRLGARPMRRVVQRSVENLVAKKLLGGVVEAGQTVAIGEDDIQLSK